MSLHAQIRPLLAQYITATGRGNMILANQTLVRIVEILTAAIEQRSVPIPVEIVAQESLGEPMPEAIWDRPVASEVRPPEVKSPAPPKRRKPVHKPARRKPAKTTKSMPD